MEARRCILKQGYLVKKSSTQHRWRTRWCLLYEDCLAYFRARDNSEHIGRVALVGAALLHPVPRYEQRCGVFMLTDRENKNYLLRAAGLDEQNMWTHAIGAAIRSLETRGKIRDCPVQRWRNLNLSEVLSAMQDPDAGVLLASYAVNNHVFSHCCSGVTLIDWLLHWNFVASRADGVDLANQLKMVGHILAVSVGPAGFRDSQDAVYRFCDLEFGNTFAGSGSSESESGELTDDDVLGEGVEGKIVREGFLSKRGFLRKAWKVRKVFLRRHPASLSIHSTKSDQKEPLRVVPLAGVRIISDGAQTADGTVDVVAKGKSNVFCLSLPEGRPLILRADDEYSHHCWLKDIQEVIDSGNLAVGLPTPRQLSQ